MRTVGGGCGPHTIGQCPTLPAFPSLCVRCHSGELKALGTPETCAPLVQALARKQREQQRAAWLALGNVEAIKAGPQLTAAQDWGAGSQLGAVGHT